MHSYREKHRETAQEWSAHPRTPTRKPKKKEAHQYSWWWYACVHCVRVCVFCCFAPHIIWSSPHFNFFSFLRPFLFNSPFFCFDTHSKSGNNKKRRGADDQPKITKKEREGGMGTSLKTRAPQRTRRGRCFSPVSLFYFPLFPLNFFVLLFGS